MKFKEVLKSVGFKSVLTLVIICVVCVGLLAVCNDLFYVSDAVLFDRQMAKIYNKPGVVFNKIGLDGTFTSPYGNVKSVTMAKQNGRDVAAVVEAVGGGGYAGTVTCYVVIEVDSQKIAAWSIKEFTGETLMSSFGNRQFSTWYVGSEVSDEIPMGSQYLSGVTMSSRAINNAINAACDYSRNVLGIGKNPQAEALLDAMQLLEGSPYADTTFATESKSPFAHLGDELTYVYSAKVEQDTILIFTYTIGGVWQHIIINASYDDAVRSAVVGESDGITEEIRNAVTTNYFNKVARISKVDGNVYTVIGYSYGMAPQITFEITIENGAVTNISTNDELTHDYSDSGVILQSFVGATLASIEGINLATGATQSNTVIHNAVLVALMHFEANNG